MALPALNEPKSWSSLGSVTIVTRVFGPKVRAQNGATCPKCIKKLVKFWVRCHIFVTTHKKTRNDPGLDQVKMAPPALNGSKSRCILVALSLAKQPPRGPFAHELSNQTGGGYIHGWPNTSGCRDSAQGRGIKKKFPQSFPKVSPSFPTFSHALDVRNR